MSNQGIERSIWINAPRERVWQAITDPALVQQWFSPTTPWALTSLEPGGKLYAVGYEAQAGVIQLVDPLRQFTYQWQSQPPDMPVTTVTTYLLGDENGGTRLNLTETVSDTLPAEVRQKRIADTNMGYKMALDNLQAYLEGKPLPYPEGL